ADYNSAIPHFERYVRARPDDGYAHFLLGYALHHAERYEEGLSEYQRALQLEPDNPDVEINVAELYMSQGKPEAAVRLFAKNASRTKLDWDDYLVDGEALAATEDYPQAESALRKSMSLDSKKPQPHIVLAKVLRALHRDPEARKEDEQAVAL